MREKPPVTKCNVNVLSNMNNRYLHDLDVMKVSSI